LLFLLALKRQGFSTYHEVFVITLVLLHPQQATPVQTWIFKQEPIVRIGRANDNQVVLYSAVVSRHHVEIRHKGLQWEIVNLGTNGTYMEGQRIDHLMATDGMIIRLARSGPMIQIRLNTDLSDSASQTAIDLPAPREPVKVDDSNTAPFGVSEAVEAPPSCHDEGSITTQDKNS
jgi:serine/threonine-protein kinase